MLKTSVYAEHGTALHAATAMLLGDDPPPLESLAGRTFNGITLTGDDVENSLRPVYNHVDALLSGPDAEYYLETRVDFPGIPGAFGTCDLLIRIRSTVHVIDFKYGSGVRVLALRPDGDEDIINSQLMYYACGARHTLPDFFADADTITLTILQPVSADPDAEMVSSVDVTHADLDAFVKAYSAVCAEALSPEPRLARGPQCRFCPAKPICPEHTKPLLDLAAFTLPASRPESMPAYLQFLAEGLHLVDAVKELGTALRDQAMAALDAGQVVPGFALSSGRAVRNWQDTIKAAPALLALGLMRDDVIEETLRSPAQVERRAKARGVKIPSAFIVSRRSGTSLVKAENAHSPVPGRGEIVRAFTAALQAFQEGSAT
jgi:hypothetical protein